MDSPPVPYGRWSETELDPTRGRTEPARLNVDESALFADPAVLARRIIWTRHLMLGALLAAVFFRRDLIADRSVFVALLGFELLPVGALLHASVHRQRRLPAYALWPDVLASVATVAVAPGLFGPALVLALAQLTAGAVACGTFAAALAGSVLLVGYPVIAVVRELHNPLDATLIVLIVFLPGMAYLAGRVRALERVTRGRYLDLLGGLDAVVWEGDPQTLELVFVSPQVLPMFGYEPAEFRASWIDLIVDEDRDQVLASRNGALAVGEDSFVLEHRMMKRNGDVIAVRNTFAVERREDGTARRLRGVIVDVTLQQESEATIRKQSQYDTLTGLPNRALFNEQLRRRVDDARRTGESLAVLLLDLNGFKEVNDTLGHAVGDQLLQAIAGRLASYLPERSLVARLGGDEFAVLVYPATPRYAATVAETVASCLQPPITIDSMTVQASASTGIALYPVDGDSLSSLMRRADAAMYEAKKSGRSHVFAKPDDNDANTRRHQLLGELRASITAGDFRLFHQPKVDLQTGCVVGTEGLIRWNHRQYGLLAPSDFIELSELSGLIQPLTRWVIERGIRDLAGWRSQGFDFTVALNLSVRNFFDQGLPSFIARQLSDHNVPGDQLVLEITEREVMADRALARSALSAFRSLGVKISIDDFGTGFSSLAQLQQLPIDEIKVDQSFIAGMLASAQDAVIVRSIIDLGHNLSLEVVAEGAEEREQILRLRELGADRVQGFAIAPAMAGDDLGRWLAQRKRVPAVGSGRVQLIADERLFDPAVERSTSTVSATSTDHQPSPGPLRSLRRAAATPSALRPTPTPAPALTPPTPAQPRIPMPTGPAPRDGSEHPAERAVGASAAPVGLRLSAAGARHSPRATAEAPNGNTRFVIGPDVRFVPPADVGLVGPAAVGETDHSDDAVVATLNDPVPGISGGTVVAPSVPFAVGTADLPPDWRSLLRSS